MTFGYIGNLRFKNAMSWIAQRATAPKGVQDSAWDSRARHQLIAILQAPWLSSPQLLHPKLQQPVCFQA